MQTPWPMARFWNPILYNLYPVYTTNEASQVHLSIVYTFYSNSVIGISSVFVEGGKPENPEKNPWSKDENYQQTQPTYDTEPELNLGHIGGRRALSPLCKICSRLSI